MDLLIPDSGLLFWMTVVFLIVFVILRKAGFEAIVKMVTESQVLHRREPEESSRGQREACQYPKRR